MKILKKKKHGPWDTLLQCGSKTKIDVIPRGCFNIAVLYPMLSGTQKIQTISYYKLKIEIYLYLSCLVIN